MCCRHRAGVRGPRGWRLVLVGWLVIGSLGLSAADKRFATLRIGDQVLSNALVLTTTRTDVFIQHAGGLANFKLAELDQDALDQLGAEVVAPPPKSKPAPSLPSLSSLQRIIAREPEAPPGAEAPAEPRPAQAQFHLPPMSRGLQILLLGLLLAGHLFFSYCAKLIVEKAGQEAGLLIWLPLLQMIPLLRAAGMAGWCVLLLFVPLVNLVVSLLWCFRIVAARDKHVIWAILLLLPVTNFIAFLYLAFAEGAEAQTDAGPLSLAEAA